MAEASRQEDISMPDEELGFRAGEPIPVQYTCEGEDISPEFPGKLFQRERSRLS
jgi:hypothetical protein